jgi:hypothetical protein
MNALLHLFFRAPLFSVVCLLIVICSILFVYYTAKEILYTPRCTDYGSAEWVVWSEVFRVNLHSFLLVNAVWFGCMIGILCAFISYIGVK